MAREAPADVVGRDGDAPVGPSPTLGTQQSRSQRPSDVAASIAKQNPPSGVSADRASASSFARASAGRGPSASADAATSGPQQSAKARTWARARRRTRRAPDDGDRPSARSTREWTQNA